MDRSSFFYERFLSFFDYGMTPDQENLFREVASFITCDDADILVVDGFAGTGKTTCVPKRRDNVIIRLYVASLRDAFSVCLEITALRLTACTVLLKSHPFGMFFRGYPTSTYSLLSLEKA